MLTRAKACTGLYSLGTMRQARGAELKNPRTI